MATTAWGTLLLSVGAVAWGQRVPAAPRGASVTWQARMTAPASQYVGPAACRSCHLPEYTEFMKTSHSRAGAQAGAGYVAGCEACHGPGQAHVTAMQNAGGDDAKIAAVLQQHLIFAFRATPEKNAAACLTCHSSSKQQQSFHESTHLARGVACQDCHSAHLVSAAARSAQRPLPTAQQAMFQVPQVAEETRWLTGSQLRQAQPNLCYTCHRSVQAKFALPVHHRVPEGLVKCTDCHTPHGSANAASLNAPAWEACLQCHVEKRGPYVYEHPPMKAIGCVACHTPHGSVNTMLLVRRDTRTLCLECHTGFHGQAAVQHSRLGFQTSGTCLRCHVMVHGSNFDPFFLR